MATNSPHILVGGVPGSGKSEWLRCAVASLILSNSPANLRLIIVDPKKNAFPDLFDSPYLWHPSSLVESPEGALIPQLDEMVSEMTRRYDLFKKAKADHLKDYVEKTGLALPRLVCVVDEFAELLMGGGKRLREEIEGRFIRIAQLGRAAGVHLILATQRPSRQIVSGMLKANIPAKVALQVANGTESRVLLDQSGAQFLLGHGDLLLYTGGTDPVRLQSAWISQADREALLGGASAR